MVLTDMISARAKHVLMYFCGASFLSVIVISAMLLPKADIILYVEHEPFVMNFEFTATTAIAKPLFDLRKIPAKVFLSRNGAPKQILTDSGYIFFPGSETKSDSSDGGSFGFKRDDAYELARFLIDLEKNPQKQFVTNLNKSIQYKFISFSQDGTSAKVSMHIENMLEPRLDLYDLKERVAGVTIGEAKKVILDNPFIERTDITVIPPFFHSIPFIQKRIDFHTRNK